LILLLIVSTVLVFPLPWAKAAVARWFCRRLIFPHGITAEFRGSGAQILGWWLLYVACLGAVMLAGIRIRHVGFAGAVLMAAAIMMLATTTIGLQYLRWFIRNIELSTDAPLRFSGAWASLLGWKFAHAVAGPTLFLWAWIDAAALRWFAHNIESDHFEAEFEGEGHQILWRGLLVSFGSVAIVTIPWLLCWFLRWVVRNFRVTISSASLEQRSPASRAYTL
jgi:hypothetical protein